MGTLEDSQIKELHRSRASFTLFIGGGCYLLFALLDIILFPELVGRFFVYRLLAVAYLLLRFVSHRRVKERTDSFAFVYLTSIVVSFPYTLMCYQTGGFMSPYYVALIVIDAAARLVFPLSARRGVTRSLLILTPYIVAGFLRGGYEVGQAINNLLFMVTSMMVSAVGGEMFYRLFMRQKKIEQELKQLNDILVERNRRDPLTNTFNRTHMSDLMRRELTRFERHGVRFSLIICDVDHFKSINDRFGHQAGDLILVSVCDRIRESIRGEDVLCRYGGEEFAIILPDTDRNRATYQAERVRSNVESLCTTWNDQPIAISLSLGVTAITNGDTLDSLIQRADAALYRAKAEGRNRAVAG